MGCVAQFRCSIALTIMSYKLSLLQLLTVNPPSFFVDWDGKVLIQRIDMTGNGEYHFAVLKNGIAGVQPAGIKEAVVFGGIFMEDSAAGTIQLGNGQ